MFNFVYSLSFNTLFGSRIYYSTKAAEARKLGQIDLAQKLIEKQLINFQFDLKSGDWFEYLGGAWYRLSPLVMEQKIFSILLKENLGNSLTPNFTKVVKTTLEMLKGVDFGLQNTKNKTNKLVPFLNGVLDLASQELIPHDPNYFFTYRLNINYDSKALLNESIINFLLSITNHNLITLQVIRSFIKCLLLCDNKYQVGIYLYGPGGTGKSTFEKILTSLVGNTNTTVLNLQDLNKQFTISKIIDKNLVLFSDVQYYTGDPSKLRLLISGDLINAERKYSDSVDIQPNALVLLSSNMLWSPKDPSTGLQRRIIYIPVTNVPTEIDRNLFNYNLITNEYSGKLADSLPGLVNWALANPDSNLSLLNNAVTTNCLIDPSAISEANPLVDWIQSSLTYCEGSQVPVGSRDSNPTTSLYSNFLVFCSEYGYKPLSLNNFSIVLVQQLNILLNKSIQRKKTKKYNIITNIVLNPERNLNYINRVNNSQNVYEEFKGFVDSNTPSISPISTNSPSSPDWNIVYKKNDTPSILSDKIGKF